MWVEFASAHLDHLARLALHSSEGNGVAMRGLTEPFHTEKYDPVNSFSSTNVSMRKAAVHQRPAL